MQTRRPIPSSIKNAPELQLGLQLYLTGFFELDLERSHAWAVTPIPGSAIRSYCKDYDFDEELTEDFCYIVRQMDNQHCKSLQAKREK